MKVLAINASPRKGGNTDRILRMVLAPLEAAGAGTEIIQIGGKNIRSCTACMSCFKNKDGRCVQDSDMFNEVVARFADVDGIILGSPTWFADVTPDMKAFMDRAGFVAQANGAPLKRKAGTAVTAVRRGGAIHCLDTMNHWLHYMQTYMVGSTYWNMVFGREPGEAENDAEGVKTMRNLGENFLALMQALAGGK